jgi:hypothetical protein
MYKRNGTPILENTRKCAFHLDPITGSKQFTGYNFTSVAYGNSAFNLTLPSPQAIAVFPCSL